MDMCDNEPKPARRVNLIMNALVWHCPACNEDNTTFLRRADVDLDDPEHAELRSQLLGDDPDLDDDFDDMDDDGDLVDMDDMDDDLTLDDLNIVMYYPPPVVRCGICDERYETNCLDENESYNIRHLGDPDDE
jgi:hypothetical protein